MFWAQISDRDRLVIPSSKRWKGKKMNVLSVIKYQYRFLKRNRQNVYSQLVRGTNGFENYPRKRRNITVLWRLAILSLGINLPFRWKTNFFNREMMKTGNILHFITAAVLLSFIYNYACVQREPKSDSKIYSKNRLVRLKAQKQNKWQKLWKLWKV